MGAVWASALEGEGKGESISVRVTIRSGVRVKGESPAASKSASPD